MSNSDNPSEEHLAELESWTPRTPSEPTAGHGFPTVIYRTPSRLVEECENAFDAGLLLAALTLVVTVPDVCANIAGTDYRTWCEEYLGLSNDGRKMTEERKSEKSPEEIKKDFEEIACQGIFTASDLYQLRCAVVHAGSSVIEGKGKKYSPYKVIGVCVQGDEHGIIASYGHTGTGIESLEGCAYDCVVKLEGLISRVAKGVRRFIEEDPGRDREYSTGKGFSRQGLVDYRHLIE